MISTITFFVKKNSIPFLLSLFALTQFSAAQSQTLFKGKIIDEQSNPIEGVSVHILNSEFGTVTNSAGIFVFKDVPAGSYILNVSHSGFAEANEKISISGQSQNEEIVLHPEYKQLSELTVTAQKREELVQQLPLSITSLSAKAVKDFHVWNVNDLTALSPNLYTGDPGDKRNVTSIRGIVTTSYDPAVATYIDGVNQFGLDTYISQLYDIQRIEILRGPQGTLYGRNAMGGVINIITKKPENKTTAFAEASVAGYGKVRITAGVRTALIKDKLFFGAAGLYEKMNGFYTNEFDNSDYDKQHSISGNYYLKYFINPKWDMNLNFKNVSNRNYGPFPLVVGDDALKNPYKLTQNAKTEMFDNTLNGSLSISHSGNSLNFNSQTSYQSNYRYYNKPIDADFSQLDGITIINNYGKDWNHVNVFTEELKFSSPAGTNSSLKWTAGTYFFNQNSPVKQATHFGKDAQMLGSPDIDYSLINTTQSKNTGIAFFGQGTYDVTSKIAVTAGLRYDYEHQHQNILGEYQKDSTPSPAFDFQPDTSASANFSAVSPKLSVDFHFTQNNSFYLTYSKGFRTGGLTPLSSDPSQPPLFRFKPEISNNIELGSKNTFFDQKLLLNATIFYSIISDVQVPTLILPDAVTITKNTGKLTSKGAEVEINALPFKGIHVSYNFGYTDAVYNSLNLSQNNTSENLKGKHQIFTPDVTSMLAVQYTIAVGSKKNTELFVRGEWKYLGKQYFDLANTIEQKAYSLFNSSIGINWKNWSLSLWGRNLSDKKYILYAYDFGGIHLGEPQLLGATFGIKI